MSANKILYVAPSFFPYTSRTHTLSMLNMAKAMSEYGYEVKFVGMASYDYESPEQVMEAYGITAGFDADFLNEKAFFGSEFLYKLQKQLMKVKFGNYVRKMVDEYKPSVIYTRNIVQPYLIFRKIVNKNDPPIVCEMHSQSQLMKDIINQKLFKKILTNSNITKIITNNTKTKEKLSSSLNQYDISVVCGYLSSADPQSNKNEGDVELKGDFSINVGYTGNIDISGLRGTQIIIKLSQNFPEIGFHIVGGGKEEVKYWKKQGNAENIFFYGHRPKNQMPDFLNLFDILINPLQHQQKSSGETIGSFPLKIPEYLAHEKAIMVSDVPGHSDLLEDEVNCLKSPPEDLETWKKNLKKLKKEPNLKAKLAKNGRKTFEKHLTHKKRIEKIFDGIF